MLRLAYLSPMPPDQTGIADYSTELLPYLAELAEVSVFAGRCDMPTSYPIHPLSHYPRLRWGFDWGLFQMGNSRHHDGLYRLFRQFSGVLVLHDWVLHHFVADYTAGQGNFAGYARELGYELGLDGLNLAMAIEQGQGEHPLFTLPLNQRLLDLSLGILVHSEFVAQRVREKTKRQVGVVPALIEPHPALSKRNQLNLPPETLILGSFGRVTTARQLPLCLQAFKELLNSTPAHFLIVGTIEADVPLKQMVAQMELTPYVTHFDFVPDFQSFLDWIATADLVVNLRHPTAGETSAIALRALAAGKPLVVSADGWYAELPDEVAWKVPAHTPAALSSVLQHLAQNPMQRAQMGAIARTYIQTHHRGQIAAQAYLTFLEELTHESKPT